MYANFLVNYIIGSLLFAWFLSWFDFDKTVTQGINDIFKIQLSTSTYYLIFLVAGITVSVIDYLSKLKQT